MPTIDTSGCSLELLNEYRTRLIADVVTGKLDVREAAASLPNEPEEPDSTDDLDEPIDVGTDLAGSFSTDEEE